MANEEKGYWFSTENGTHIHADEGESKESAMKKKFSNFGKEKEYKESFDKINEKRMGTDRPEFAKKIDEESKPTFDSAKQIDSIYKNAKEKNLDFERSLLNDIKSNPDKYNRFTINGSTYIRNGLSFDKYKDGKRISTGTVNSVAVDVANSYEDTETKLSKANNSKQLKEFDKLEKKVDKFSLQSKATPIKREIKQYMAGAKNGTISKEKTISQMEDRIKYLQRSNLLDTNPLRDPLLEYYQKAIEIVKSY